MIVRRKKGVFMSGYRVSLEQVRRMSHLNIEFEEIIRSILMFQARRFCPFEKPKCEHEAEAQKTTPNKSSPKLPSLEETIKHVEWKSPVPLSDIERDIVAYSIDFIAGNIGR